MPMPAWCLPHQERPRLPPRKLRTSESMTMPLAHSCCATIARRISPVCLPSRFPAASRLLGCRLDYNSWAESLVRLSCFASPESSRVLDRNFAVHGSSTLSSQLLPPSSSPNHRLHTPASP